MADDVQRNGELTDTNSRGNDSGDDVTNSGMELQDVVYSILFNPRETLTRLAQGPSYAQAALIFAVATGVSGISSALATTGGAPFQVSPAGLVLLTLVFGAVGWFLGAGFFSLFASLLGGEGQPRRLFALMGYSQAPSIFLAPVALLGRTPLSGLEPILSLGVSIWVAGLYGISIKRAFNLSTGRALAVLLLPLALIVVLVLATVVFFAGVMTQLDPGIFTPFGGA